MAGKKAKSTAKKTVKKRSLNASGGGQHPEGAPFSELDVKRRLGNYVTTGEHARVGGRTTGIVRQTKQKFGTDKRKK